MGKYMVVLQKKGSPKYYNPYHRHHPEGTPKPPYDYWLLGLRRDEDLRLMSPESSISFTEGIYPKLH